MKLTFWVWFLTNWTAVALCQPKPPYSYKDYFVVNMNPDSLQREVYARKGDPVRYLHELIWLEYSRYKISDNFGDDLGTIQKLAHQQHSAVGIAMYNYLMGLRYKQDDAPRALNHVEQALTYFARTRDTSGMAHCHLALMRLNIDNYNEEIGDMDRANYHFDRTRDLVEHSSDNRDKISLMPRYLAELDLFYPPMPMAEVEKKYLTIRKMVDTYPEMRFMLKDIYLNLSFFYLVNKEYKVAIEKLNLSLQFAAHCSSYNRITIYSNLASAYEGLGDYVGMQNQLKKILTVGPSKNTFNDYVRIEANYGMAIAISRNRKLDDQLGYLIAYDTLKRAYTERMKIKDLLKLQTKYESAKKEATIRVLELEKQQTEIRNRFIMAGLISALVVIGMIGFLAVRLQKTNAELQSLQQSRDKLYTVIAHDLREPINSLMSTGTLLRYLIKQNRNDDIERVTQKIDLMGQQVGLLLTNLLDWGKSTYLDQHAVPKMFDAAPLLKELAQLYVLLAETKEITLSIQVPDSYLLTAHPKDVALIVRNLLDNALKYTRKGGNVTLSVHPDKSIIRVEDTGIGMSPDQLIYIQHVFSGKETPQVGEQGIGLGLLLITDFARKNGATLRLSSQEGLGSAFDLITV